MAVNKAEAAPVALSCSADQAAANINEINDNNSGSFFDFVEVKILRDTADIEGWSLCAARDGKLQACEPLGKGQGSWSDGSLSGDDSQSVNGNTVFMADTWLIYETRALSNKGEAALLDAGGDVLDHIAWDGDSSCDKQNYWSVPGACSVCISGKDADSKTLARVDPDGTGDWVDSRRDPTPAATNTPVGAGCELAGFELTPAATALACPQTRAALSLRALCADGATTKTDYQGTVELASDRAGTLFFSSDSSSETIDAFTFPVDSEGLATLYYYHPGEAQVAITVTDTAAGVSTTGSSTEFRAFGFLAGAVAGAQAACEASNDYTLTAFGQLKESPGCGVIEGFSGVKNLKIWSEYLLPASNPFDTRVRVNGVPVATEESVRYAVTFVDGEAGFNIGYPDAGRIRVHFKHDEDPYDGNLYGAMEAQTPPIDVVPAGFGITASTAAGSLLGSDHTAAEMAPAGDPFRLRIQAQCDDGTATPNYRPASARLALSQGLPEPGVLTLVATEYVANSGSAGINGLFSEGAVDDSAARYSEVGVLEVTVEDPDYPGGAIGPSLARVGRFHPHHFDLAVNDPGALSSDCGAFVYTGQQAPGGEGALNYAARPPVLRIIPRNAQGELTANYIGNYVKLQPEDVRVEPPLVDSVQKGADGTTALALDAGLSPGTLVEVTEGGRSGYLDYIFSPNDHFRYLRQANSRVAPFSARLNLTVAEVRDRNGDTDVGNDVIAGGALPILTPAGLEVRYGRLQLDNAFGPETENLTVPLRAQFFDGARFQLNALDSCTSFGPADAFLDHGPYPDDNLQEAETEVVAPATVTALVAGTAPATSPLTLKAPGLGNEGQVAVILDVAPWLEGDWAGAGDQDPQSQVTFGRYRGHDRVIYWQEPLGR